MVLTISIYFLNNFKQFKCHGYNHSFLDVRVKFVFSSKMWQSNNFL